MPRNALDSLLLRIRDGLASPAEIARARDLVATDARLPEELREVVDFEDAVGDAVGLLAVLGADSLFGEALREGIALELAEPEIGPEQVDGDWELAADFVAAVRAEAGEVELSDAVIAVIGGDARLAVGEAVRAEAGDVELADAVLARLGLVEPERGLLAAAVASEAGSVDVVAAVEGELTELRLPLAAAIASEAGTVELADLVLAAIGGPERIPVAEAVRSEAGSVELWSTLEPAVSDAWVSAMLDHELSPAAHRAAVLRLQGSPECGALMTAFASLGGDVRRAVASEAGEVESVWAAVASAIGVDAEEVAGWSEVPFAAAVRSEAGGVDVAAAVMQSVQRVRMPYAAIEVEAVPAPANQNTRWTTSALLMAMAAAFLVMALPGTWSVEQAPRGPEVTWVDAFASAKFASADEIVVEALDVGDQANVYQATGDAGALILWVDEGATL